MRLSDRWHLWRELDEHRSERQRERLLHCPLPALESESSTPQTLHWNTYWLHSVCPQFITNAWAVLCGRNCENVLELNSHYTWAICFKPLWSKSIYLPHHTKLSSITFPRVMFYSFIFLCFRCLWLWRRNSAWLRSRSKRPNWGTSNLWLHRALNLRQHPHLHRYKMEFDL